MGKYKWKDVAPGVSGHRLMAQAVGQELERLFGTGPVELPVIVREAKSPDSPLHDGFEWRNRMAAEKYREEQARHIIQCLVYVQPRPEGGKPLEVRAYVNVRRGQHTPGSYVHVTVAMANKDTRQEVIDRAWREIQEWERRYERFKEFATIVGSIRKTREKRGK